MITYFMSITSKTNLRRWIVAVTGTLVLVLCAASARGQATTVALMPIPKPSFYAQNGLPLSGGFVYTYITGTSTPLGTFTDSTGTIPNPNPVPLDAGGFVNPGIWLIVGDTYRIVVQDQNHVQQYLVDGVVGVGGGTLSLFSTPNTWTALQTFSGGASINGGTLNGTFSGNPAFSGTPQFSTFTISNATVIANLNASLWNGTSASAGGSLTNGWVPVVTGPAASTWGPITAGILPGAGITTINGTPCTIGSSCSTLSLYSTPSASTAASIALTGCPGATCMATVGASNATYRFNFYAQESVLGASCTGNTTLQVLLTFQDPLAAAPTTTTAVTFLIANNSNGVLGPAQGFLNFPLISVGGSVIGDVGIIRAKTGTAIQYSTTYTAGTGCAPGPQYVLFPILEQLTVN